jgi:hypothetical protein
MLRHLGGVLAGDASVGSILRRNGEPGFGLPMGVTPSPGYQENGREVRRVSSILRAV